MKIVRIAFHQTAVASALLTILPSASLIADDHETITVTGQRVYNEQQAELATQNSTAVDLSDALASLSGIDINNNGPATSILQYRGLFGDRVNTMIDGATVTGAGPNAMDSPLSHILAEPGASVTAIRGIAPVTAGPETLGGHVSIGTDEQQYFLTRGQYFGHLVGQTQSTGDMYQASGSMGYGQENAYALVVFTQQNADEMEDGSGRQIPNFRYDRKGGKVKFGVKLDEHQLHASLQRLDTDDAGTPALGMDIKYIDAQWYRLKYQYSPDSDKGLSLTLFGNDNEHGMDNVSQRITMEPMARLNTVDAESIGLDSLFFMQTPYGLFEAGINWVDDEHNSVITNPVLNNLTINNFNGITRESLSGFAQISDVHNELKWSAGIRLGQVDSDAGEVGSSMAMMNPNVASLVNAFNGADRAQEHSFVDLTFHADYAVSDTLTGTLAVAQKTRAPSYTELYTWLPLTISAGLADGFTYLGNLELQEEVAHQIDAGIRWQGESWSLLSNVYYQAIDDYIVGVPVMNDSAMRITMMMGNSAPLQWQNVDANLYGAELTGQYTFTPYLSLSVTANMVRGERDDIDDNLFRMSPNSLRAVLNWQKEQMSVSLESVLFDRQDRVSLLQNEEESAGYGLINLVGSYQLGARTTLSLRADNLFDKNYQPHLAGVNRVQGAETPVGERLFSPGRQIMASVQYRFGI